MSALLPQEILKKYWGYENFRDGQLEIIQSILQAKDTFALLPTGAGKSICYQVPSLMLDHCTLVISPLIALMQDQVQSLKQKSIFADYIHSGLHSKNIDRILDNARDGQLKLLYISPERLSQESFLARLTNIKINFVAIDEAHCISQWGHDFRPAYLLIKKIREQIPCNYLALTATASEKVKEDIFHFLELKNPNKILLSSARNNLSLSVRFEENKINQVQNILPKFRNSGLLYCRNRRLTVEYAEQLSKLGIKIDYYHAGLEHDVRKKKFESWLKNQIQYMCCTTAFGMGIDKSDVDLIIHLELPGSLEEYYQEVGRAGRGGQKAYGLCLYNERDLRRLIKLYENSFPNLAEVQETYKCLALELGYATGSQMEYSVDFDFEQFCAKYKLKAERTIHTLKLLVQSGWIYLHAAFFIPSRLMVLASVENLENYYSLNKEYQSVIQSCLRLYEGIFSVSVQIQENVIAFQAQLKRERVVQILQFLHQEEIIQYIPQREKPQIQILNERVHFKDIFLDEKWIEERKKVLKNQIDAVLQYVKTGECRQKFILHYLGETQTNHCGICDNCLKNKKAQIDPKMRTVWKSEMMDLIKKENKILLRSVYQHFPSNKKHWVDVIIQELIGEKKISREVDFLCLFTELD